MNRLRYTYVWTKGHSIFEPEHHIIFGDGEIPAEAAGALPSIGDIWEEGDGVVYKAIERRWSAEVGSFSGFPPITIYFEAYDTEGDPLIPN